MKGDVTGMEFAQLYDRVETSGGDAAIDASALAGTYINSNPLTNGIARMVVAEKDGRHTLRVYAVGPEEEVDWGETELQVYASGPAARTAAGFTCRYDFGFADVRLQAMVMKGLVVLSQFHHFKDESGRADFFVREYYALVN